TSQFMRAPSQAESVQPGRVPRKPIGKSSVLIRFAYGVDVDAKRFRAHAGILERTVQVRSDDARAARSIRPSALEAGERLRRRINRRRPEVNFVGAEAHAAPA